MSLAFSHDRTISIPASTRRTVIRKSTVDLAFILAFVAFAVVSILVVATQSSSPETESAIADVAEL